MQNRYVNRIGLICLVLALCLAAIGVGYGTWSRSLDIDGTVSTGEVDIEFVWPGTYYMPDPDDPGTWLPSVATRDNEQPDVPAGPPDLGTIVAYLSDGPDDDGDYSVMTVLMNFGYFCYTGYVDFQVHNNGTVPVKVSDIDITVPINGEVEVWLNGLSDGSGATPATVIDPCQYVSCTLIAHIATNESVIGGYSFSVAIEVENYNEGGG